MRVAIDLDNVTVEWQAHWADLYTHWFDVYLDPTDLEGWSACLDATHFESMGEFYGWFRRARGWHTQPYLAGAQGGLLELQHAGIPFFFLTARPKEGEDAARMIAAEWGTTVQFQHAGSKHLAPSTVWVDDSPEVLASLEAHGKTSVRFEQPWNVDVTATHTAATWPALVAVLKGI